MAKEKGYSRLDDIPGDYLAKLNAGEIESRTLVEGLAVDFHELMRATIPGIPDHYVERVRREDGVTKRMQAAGETLWEYGGTVMANRLMEHPSDTVRGWAAYAQAATPDVPVADRLEQVRVLADDPHFGVREWAWLAVRPYLVPVLDEALDLLRPWVDEDSENIRRFAVEVTRPRGVWTQHIPALKADPSPGLPLLEPVRADGSKYVQDSVANWLNDAAKTQPEWVTEVCDRWLTESATPQTARICKRARRSLPA